MKRFISALLTVIIILLMLLPVALAAETAVTMRLAATEGTVTVTNKNGKQIAASDNMKLYNAYNVITSAKSYAYISLDDDKAVKMDAGTQIEIRKSGKKLEIHLLAGRIFCDVKAPLGKDETLNIKTSTTVTGVRGTSLCVSLSEDKIEIQLYSGAVMTLVEGSGQGFGLTAGEKLTLGDEAAEEAIAKLETGDIPGFVAVLIAADPSLEQIFRNIDLDAVQLINDAERLLKQDEEAQGEAEVYYPPKLEPTPTPAPNTDSGSGSMPSTPSEPEPEVFSVTFMTNGGGTIDSQSIEQGKTISKPGDPVKDAYTFAGWFADPGFSTPWYFVADVVTSDMTLYAAWTLNTLGGEAVISGTYKIGQMLSIDTQNITGAGSGFTYQWKADDDDISNAKNATYTIQGADVEKVISCEVTHPIATGSITSVGAAVPYTVSPDITGAGTGDSVTLSPDTGFENDVITVSYTIADIEATNLLDFSGVTGVPGTISGVGNGSWTYTVDPSEAAAGVITIAAAFTHTPLEADPIAFTESEVTKTYGDDSFANALTTTPNGGVVTYTSSNQSVAEVNVNTGEVTIAGAGSARITAHKTADEVYAAATAYYDLTVDKADPAVTWPGNINATYGDILEDVTFSGGTGDGTFEWTTPGDAAGTAGTQQHSMTFTPTDEDNYNILTKEDVNITVNQKSVTATLTVDNKEYDGSPDAVVSNIVINGKVGNDDVTVTGGTAQFVDKSVGTVKTVTFSGYELDGAVKDNYTLSAPPANATADITARQLTISAPTGSTTKEYNGTATADLTAGTLTNAVEGDNITVSIQSATYNSANVTEATQITVVYAIDGTDAGNYTKPVDGSVSGSITARLLNISAPTGSTTKEYDGTITANLEAGTPTNAIASDNITVSFASVTYNNANVSDNNEIIGVYSYGGTETALGNYNKPVEYKTTGIITARQLTVSEPSGTTKVYDGTTTALETLIIGTLDNAVQSDEITVSIQSATYNSANVSDATTITVVYAISGADAGNYIKPVDANVEGSIAALQLTISPPSGTTKVYDGTATGTLIAGTLGNFIEDDDVRAYVYSAVYNSALVLLADHISVSYAIEGEDAGNYIKPVDADVVGSITPAAGAAVSGAPTVNGTPTHNSITVNTVNAVTNDDGSVQEVKYAISNSADSPSGEWQVSTTFTGLDEYTDYYVFARTAASDNYYEGAAECSTAIRTSVNQGDGSAEKPFKVYDEETLAQVGRGNNGWTRDANYLQIADIELTVENWTPIGEDYDSRFAGTYDGGGKKISGLIVSDAVYAGLFGYFTGEVKNVTLDGVSVAGIEYAGGVAAYNFGTVTGCTVSGDISAIGNDGAYAGGVVGSNSGKIIDCHVSGTVKAQYDSEYITYGSYAGGVAGYNDGTIAICSAECGVESSGVRAFAGGIVGEHVNYNGSTIDCYTSGGTVTATGDVSYAGGVAGSNDGTVRNCYTESDVVVTAAGTDSYAGGVVGSHTNYNGKITNCVALNASVSGGTASGRIIGSNENGEITNCHTSLPLDSSSDSGEAGITYGINPADTAFWITLNLDTEIWNLDVAPPTLIEGARLLGTKDRPIEVGTEADLRKVGSGDDGWTLDAYYVQKDDIILEEEDWYPIGSYGSGWEFIGNYDGGNYTISNLTIAEPSGVYIGLFGFVGENGIVKNVNLTGVDINITGSSYTAGGVVGYNYGTVMNCTVSGEIVVEGGSNSYRVGGVVGQNNGEIINCAFQGSVSASGNQGSVGGIAGMNYLSTSVVRYCYSTAAVSATGTMATSTYAGGVIGVNSGTVENCVALNESVTGDNTGRVSGDISGISDCFAWTGITGTVAADGTNLDTRTPDQNWWTNTEEGPGFDPDIWNFSSTYPAIIKQ